MAVSCVADSTAIQTWQPLRAPHPVGGREEVGRGRRGGRARGGGEREKGREGGGGEREKGREGRRRW